VRGLWDLTFSQGDGIVGENVPQPYAESWTTRKSNYRATAVQQAAVGKTQRARTARGLCRRAVWITAPHPRVKV
jgi:hypothetical protein